MPVYEIKNPLPPPSARPLSKQKLPAPVPGISQILRLRPLPSRPESAPRDQNRRRLSRREKRNLRLQVGQANLLLQEHGLPHRLVLSSDENGFLLDIYDCTDQQACRIIGDRPIFLDQLAALLAGLQQKTGIFLDLVS